MPETLPAARPTRTPKALREDRAKIAAEIRRMADDGTAADADGNFTPGWVQANADYDALTRQITSTEAVAKRLDDMKAEDEARAGAVRAVGGFRSFGDGRATGGDGAETAATEEQRAMALQAWCRVQMGRSRPRRRAVTWSRRSHWSAASKSTCSPSAACGRWPRRSAPPRASG
jgi:hypothetical protein